MLAVNMMPQASGLGLETISQSQKRGKGETERGGLPGLVAAGTCLYSDDDCPKR
jgi:hypothetical protein